MEEKVKEPPNTDEAKVKASPKRKGKHQTRAHAVCSSSSSKMWINCPPSARLQELYPNETSIYAEAGTFVHELCEYKLKKAHKKRVRRPQSEEYDDEAAEHNSDLYCEIVTEAEEAMRTEHGEVVMFVEEKLDFSSYVPDGFGSGDCVLCSPGELHVFDYKNGHLFVDADHNSQMMLYALAAVTAYDFIFDFKTVSMTIVQPNVENISTYTISKRELLDWGEWLKPIAKLAYEGKGELKTGDHCRWCKAKAQCPARMQEALSLAREEFLDLDANDAALSEEETDATASYNPDTETAVFKQPMLVPQEEIEHILPLLNRIEEWITSVFAYVSNEAIQHGVKWKGYKVVEGRSKRQFTDTKAVVEAATEAGYAELYKQELISLTEFEKMMGKKTFQSVLGEYVVKPPGKLTLVPESDPRDAVDTKQDVDEFEVLEDSADSGNTTEYPDDEGLPFN